MNWNVETVCDYVANTELLGVEELVAEEIGDGNLNLVFRVYVASDPSRSLILKQAPPHIKVLGPDYPLSQRRLAIEATALRLYHQLMPGSVPQPLRYDADAHLILMEELRGFRILRYVLMDGKINTDVAASAGEFMGRVHDATHTDRLSDSDRQRYQTEFHNPEMHAITTDYVFTKPFQIDPTNRHTPGLDAVVAEVRADTDLLDIIGALRTRFVEAQEGVVHGDLHTGSIMVKGAEARVMDAEFAFYGPIAFDVGALVANYLLAWYAHPASDRAQLMQCIVRCWEEYAAHFSLIAQLDTIWREAIQFAGVKMLRRILGAAHVQDIESIEDLNQRRAVEEQAIACGRQLILNPPNLRDLPAVAEKATLS